MMIHCYYYGIRQMTIRSGTGAVLPSRPRLVMGVRLRGTWHVASATHRTHSCKHAKDQLIALACEKHTANELFQKNDCVVDGCTSID